MRKLIAILFLMLPCATAKAQLTYGTLTITNTPVNGSTLTIQGTAYYWTNGAGGNGGLSMQLTNTFGGCATNAATAVASPLAAFGISISPQLTATSNVLQFYGNALTMSISASWATLVMSTNTGAGATNVIVPISSIANASRIPIESQLAKDLDQYAQFSFATGGQLHSNYSALSGTNTFTGTNIFANLNGTVGSLTNGGFLNPNLTNGQNFGNPFRSPGTGTGSEQFGLGAAAVAPGAVAFGDGAYATNGALASAGAVAFGYQASAYGNASVALGASSLATNNGALAIGQNSAAGNQAIAIGATAAATNVSSIAIGQGNIASGRSSAAIGQNANSTFDYSTALGQNANSTAIGQIMLGTTSNVVTASGVFANTTVSNLTFAGSNIIGGSLSFPQYANTSLASGANAGVSPGTSDYVKVSGPSTNFTINGISGGANGREILIQNSTGFSMTIANDSGVDPTATNRIYTGSGADITSTNNPLMAVFRYDLAATHWILISLNGIQAVGGSGAFTGSFSGDGSLLTNLPYRAGFTNVANLSTSQAIVFNTPFPSSIGTNYSVSVIADSTLAGAVGFAATSKTTNGFTLTLNAGIAGGVGVDYTALPYR